MNPSSDLIGSNYKGDMVDGRYHGSGTLTTDKDRYVGEFYNGQFHGEGVMYVTGGKFVGTWTKGALTKGQFVFTDGLHHRMIDKKFWEYCSHEDPRFYKEIQDGLQLGDPLLHETAHGDSTPRLPLGCYDTVDGYYDPKKLSVCTLATQEAYRMPDKEEKEWIVRNCRLQR